MQSLQTLLPIARAPISLDVPFPSQPVRLEYPFDYLFDYFIA